MARGITEKDVFTACDALVLAGERPTIERVRQKIGRGSPNTVSPMLDTWFRGLGRRLRDPGSFAPAPDIPEPVLQAAQHFWEVAQAGARVDLEERVTERLALMQAQVERVQHAQAVAEAEKDTAAALARDAREQLTGATARLDAERVAHGATTARADAARDQIADLQLRLAAAEAQARDAQERARREIEAAQERATGAERRAALEIETERAARVRADKRADALEIRVQTHQASAASHLEEAVATRTTLEHERRQGERLQRERNLADQLRLNAEAALLDAKLAIERAVTEAKTTQAAMARLLPLVEAATNKKTAPKERASGKSR